MATKKDETASFVLRFTQKIFQNEEGEPQIQWRGNMRHVQTGDEKTSRSSMKWSHLSKVRSPI